MLKMVRWVFPLSSIPSTHSPSPQSINHQLDMPRQTAVPSDTAQSLPGCRYTPSEGSYPSLVADIQETIEQLQSEQQRRARVPVSSFMAAYVYLDTANKGLPRFWWAHDTTTGRGKSFKDARDWVEGLLECTLDVLRTENRSRNHSSTHSSASPSSPSALSDQLPHQFLIRFDQQQQELFADASDVQLKTQILAMCWSMIQACEPKTSRLVYDLPEIEDDQGAEAATES